MEIIIKILQFILSFSLLVFVHEMGHFLFAKLFKIRVEKFYMFFNPGFSLFKFNYKGTEYGMGWIPFGGYVSIAGMIDETKDATKLASEPQEWEFRSKPAWQRLLVMTGGVIMNIITAIVIFIFMSYSYGTSYIDTKDIKGGFAFTPTAKEIGFMDGDKILSVDGESYENYIKYREAIIINNEPIVLVDRGGERVEIKIDKSHVSNLLKDQVIFDLRMPFGIDSILNDGALAETGIKKGDKLISVNGKDIEYVDELITVAQSNRNSEIKLIVEKAGAQSRDTVAVMVPESGSLGVLTYSDRMANYYPITHKDYSIAESIPLGFTRTWDMCVSYVKQMKMIFSPETEAYKSVGSVMTMVNIFPAEWNWANFWGLTALFSVILAVMNILPIPALDGGYVLFLLVELISGRKPSDKFLERANMIGIYILIGIMILAMWNDIAKFIL